MNKYRYDNLYVGQTESFRIQVTKDMEDEFRRLTCDINPLHQDDDFARNVGNGQFKGHVVFGMLTASFYSTLAGVYLPGENSLIHSLEIKFINPVYVDDWLTVTGEIVGTQEDLKLILIKAVITNQENQKVSKAKIKILVLK